MGKKLFILVVVTVALIAGGSYYAVHKAKEVADRLAADEAATNLKKVDISVTIIEGKRREEVAKLLEDKGICSAASFLAASANDEGKLFPDTYRFFPKTPASDVVDVLTANFAKKAGAPTEDQLILASIVEREALHDADRPAIAGLYQNRLDIGMALESDPTVQYAKDSLAFEAAGESPTYKFWSEITQADYHGVVSPFNMYLHTGLPPAPLDSPGAASIAAAIHPDQSGGYLYLYYKGEQMLLAKTYAQHLKNVGN